MANYTNTKWVYEKTSTGIRQICSEGKVLADVSGLEDGIDNMHRKIEANDNAQLMAAAPDLLDVCKELFNLLEHEQPVWYLRGHYNRASMAITKATQATLQPK